MKAILAGLLETASSLVLILIVMEDTHEERLFFAISLQRKVLILIVMEDTHEVVKLVIPVHSTSES